MMLGAGVDVDYLPCLIEDMRKRAMLQRAETKCLWKAAEARNGR
jgi:hypothetical protein